ncbi:TPA: glycosyltransferase [Pseudomonas aeruginosa]|nr:glycosyltransferase [Pseudomonas aeruginosa]
MQTKYTINSDAYWDSRFVEDWESLQGPAQSRFFARLAIENLPRWLIDQLQRQPLTLCDWGCAQGDGTDVWASYVDSDRITGIDFSSVAVDQALKRYPAIRFLNEDWLAAQPGEQSVFDVVFSSNTLEHFHKPHAVLKSLCSRATKALVLALPYRELDRHHEHFYTFLPDNIPTAINGGFKLVWSRVVDCRQISNTLWGGDQIVLVYANSDWTDALRLTLRDFGIEQSDFAAKIVSLNQAVTERDGQIVSLNQAVTERDGQITSLIEAVVERDEQITGLNQAVAERDGQITSLKQAVAERDGRITSQYAQLMTFSNWASSIDKHPLKHAFKKTALGIARGTLRSMPVSIATKQRLRDVFFSTIRPLRQSVRRKSAQVRPADEAAPPRGQRPSAGVARDVFVFAVIDWHFRIQRPQHIARSLAESGHRVFYFSNHFVDADEPGYQLERLPGADALYQVKLHVKGARAIYFDPPSDQALAMLTRSIAKVIQDFSALSSLSIVQHAYWYPLVKRLPNSYRIYDCMDHHEGFGNVPAKLVEIEKEMLCSADLVTVTSSWLEDFARKHNPSVALVRNAAEYRHFVTRPEQVYKDGKGRRIIGYYGAIAEWFDIDLVRTIALEHPDCLILLVGNDTVGAQKVLADLPNVEFTGEVPYATLPFYLHAFDVCLLPFKVIPLTLATNPVKVYEYLAAGKPVVCVDLPEVGQFGDLVSRACSTDDFVALVGASLQESGVLAEQKSAERRRFASEQTWCHRGAELATALKAVRMPRVSVIILTFNNLDLTRACLDSVLERSDYPNLEVIVVDNASSDGTSAYLEDFARRHPDVRVVLNRENLGFAAGNNVGLSIATGDYLVVLNNDTVVTQGWVMTLLRHFQNDPSLGIVGPVTNNIGNEARIETRYQSMEEMPGEALRYTLANMGNTYPIRTAAFFCVMFPRSVYELCGPICEDYGRGFFEDDDYCRRVESIGKRVVCADDVFIHHHLSASFNKLKDSERQELFRKNKEIYEKKWGPWVPHSYRN